MDLHIKISLSLVLPAEKVKHEKAKVGQAAITPFPGFVRVLSTKNAQAKPIHI